MKLSILMPCLNESDTLETCIKKAQEWLRQSGVSGEIVVADNGSTDGSQEIARKNGAVVVDVPVRGYGSALYYGSLAAKGKYIVMGDSDDSYDFSRLDAFVDKLEAGNDLVMGNRFAGGIEPGAMPWKNRYIGNPVLTWIGRTLFECPARDFHCGLRGVRKDAFLRMDLRTTGMEFASEMVIKANLMKMRIAEVPTTLSRDGRSRPPHLRPWRDGWRHLRFMLLFSPRWLFVVPGLILGLLSLVLYTALLVGPISVSGIEFDINTLFYAQAGIVVGVTAVSLGLMVRTFGVREGLLPEHMISDYIRKSPLMEAGGILGILLVIVGVCFGVDLLSQWGGRELGSEERNQFLRMVSLSSLMVTLGGVSFLSSLVMGFLALPLRRTG